MNKKFSTLMAGLLLAGSVGAVVPYNSYVNSGAKGELVQTVEENKAYQLFVGDKVLVMAANPANDGVMELTLQDPTESDLMSTLWTIQMSDDSEGGISYTFLNKATGLPLAFNSKEAEYNGSNATNATGDVSLWKWRSGVSVTKDAQMYSNFDKDSALVLVKKGDAIVASKICTKDATPNGAKFNAYEATSVYLGANALNSMLGIQDPNKDQLQLAFEREVMNSEIGNLLTKNKYTAVGPVGTSTSMEARPALKPDLSEEQKKVVEAASDELDINNSTNINLRTSLVAEAATKVISSNKDLVEDQKATINTALETAVEATNTIKSAVGAVSTLDASYTAKATAAKAINTAVQAFKDSEGAYSADEFNKYSDGLNLGELQSNTYKQVDIADLNALLNVSSGYDPANFIKVQTETVNDAKTIAALLNAASTDVNGQDALSWDDVNNIVDKRVNESTLGADDKEALITALKKSTGTSSILSSKSKIVNDLTVFSDYFTAAATAISELGTPVIGETAEADFISSFEAITVEGEEGAAVKKAIQEAVTSNWTSLADAQATVAELSATYADESGAVSAAYTAAKAVDAAGTVESALQAIIDRNSEFTDAQKNIINELIAAAEGNDVETAMKAAYDVLDSKYYNPTDEADLNWVSLRATEAADSKDNTYLMVDTAYMTGISGDKLLPFNIRKYKELSGVNSDLVKDYTGRYNFKFTYYPTQDSLDVKVDGYSIKPETRKYWSDMTSSDVQTSRAKDGNLVKLAMLTDEHYEVTVGHAEEVRGTDDVTINTRIYLDAAANLVRTTLPSGVYHFNLVTNKTSRKADNGKYGVASYRGDVSYNVLEAPETTQKFGVAQDFNYIPRTQWVVEQNEGVDGAETVNITNREFPNINYKNVQLYKAGDNVFATIGTFALPKDTLSFKLVDKKYTTNENLGYKRFAKAEDYEKFYNLDYLSGIELGNYVNVTADSVVYVDLNDGKTYVEFIPTYEYSDYGYTSSVANASQLRRQAYKIRVNSEALLTESDCFITWSKDLKTFEVSSSTSGRIPAVFMLKENNELVAEDGTVTPYYALQAINPNYINGKAYIDNDVNYRDRVGVRDASMKFSAELPNYYSEVRVATFAVVEDTTPLYRRLGATLKEDGFKDMDVQNAKIYTVNSAEKEYLYEDTNSKYSEGLGINFLGLEGKGVNATNTTMFVDTAYVRNNTNMPQYMLVMDPQIVKADTIWCNATASHTHATLADSLACPHTEIIPASVTGRYLINAQDSVDAGNTDYVWNRDYTRLAFVEAKHIGDTLVIFRNGKPSTAAADSIFLGNNSHNYKNSKNPVFAFRLVNTDACDFLIETVGDHKIPSNGEGGWVAVKNGVPVVARLDSYNDAINDAEIFNIEATDEQPTANETIAAGNVVVAGTNGAVVVKGAEGKNVIVSTILGKVVANEVLTSDNAQITAPQGVVVVSVDGESFKVVVK